MKIAREAVRTFDFLLLGGQLLDLDLLLLDALELLGALVPLEAQCLELAARLRDRVLHLGPPLLRPVRLLFQPLVVLPDLDPITEA
jgi:hypothetical protein